MIILPLSLPSKLLASTHEIGERLGLSREEVGLLSRLKGVGAEPDDGRHGRAGDAEKALASAKLNRVRVRHRPRLLSRTTGHASCPGSFVASWKLSGSSTPVGRHTTR
jgi:hypothetical protein